MDIIKTVFICISVITGAVGVENYTYTSEMSLSGQIPVGFSPLSVRSKLDCATYCTSDMGCYGFYFSQTVKVCFIDYKAFTSFQTDVSAIYIKKKDDNPLWLLDCTATSLPLNELHCQSLIIIISYTGRRDYIDECADPYLNDCDVNAVCTNELGSYSCDCNTGFSGDGTACADVNECSASSTNNCHVNAACTNNVGSYTCSCNGGFIGDGTTCTDIDECADPSTNNCDVNAACSNNAGSFTCTCNAGYNGDGITCTGIPSDVDECADPTANTCDTNAACSNIVGSYKCACNAGYNGDGTTCTDVDECADPTANNCDTNAACSNTVGSYTCACNAGYNGDGITCTVQMFSSTFCPSTFEENISLLGASGTVYTLTLVIAYVTQTEAVTACSSLGKNLIKVNDDVKIADVGDFLKSCIVYGEYQRPYWTDATKQTSIEEPWRNSDGSTASVSSVWCVGPADNTIEQLCIRFRESCNYKLNDIRCEAKLSYICE